MTWLSDTVMTHSRRRFLQMVAATTVFVSACTTSRQTRDVEQSLGDLQRLLDDIAATPVQRIRLRSVVRRVEIRTRDLVEEQEEFRDTFHAMLREREATQDELLLIVERHGARRQWLRNDLLRLQDELHAVLSPDQWREVTEVLNRSGSAIARRGVRKS